MKASHGDSRAPVTSPAVQMWVAVVISGALTGLMFATVVRPGLILARDFVAVPDPVVNAASLGLDGHVPRAVPLDLVGAVVDPVIPVEVQQRLMILLAVAGSGIGLAWLVRSSPWAAPAAAAVGIWNPFVVERLLLGQVPTLLAYSMIPWIVAAVLSSGGLRRRAALVTVAAAPAALTPWGGIAAVITVLAVVSTNRRRRPTELMVVAGPLTLLIPWALPAVLQAAGGADPDGAAAFAPRADVPGGVVPSVLTLGGAWAESAHLPSRASGLTLLSSAAIIGLAGFGAWWLWRRRSRAGLLAFGGWVAPACVVMFLGTSWGIAMSETLQAVPGIGLVRDSHRLLGWSAAAVAVLAGVGISRLVTCLGSSPAARGIGPVLAVACVSLAVLTAPDAAGRLRETYRPVEFPREWSAAIVELEGADRVLVMPWTVIRAPGWNDRRPFVDPLPQAARAETVRSTALTVRRRNELLVVDDGEPSDARLWRRGLVPSTSPGTRSIDAVFIWKDTPGAKPEDMPGFVRVHDGPHFAVWRRAD